MDNVFWIKVIIVFTVSVPLMFLVKRFADKISERLDEIGQNQNKKK